MAAWTYGGGTVSAPGEAEYLDARLISSDLISSDLISVFRVSPLRGSSFLAAEDKVGAAPVAIISTRLWQNRYGANPSVVGMSLTYDGKAYTVVGVAPSSL